MINELKHLRLSHTFKNFLILAPILGSQGLASEFNYLLFFNGLISFSFLTLSCYLINDYTDKKTYKKNILKKKKSLALGKRKVFSILGFLILLFVIHGFYFSILNNIFLFCYFLNFLLYNFYLKKFKIIDLLMLNNFYIIRILYGAKLFVIDITFGFIIFFYFLFLGLSTAKRSIQVSSNKLKINNLISPYYVGDLKILKKSILFSFLITLIILALFILNIQNIITLEDTIFLPSFLNFTEILILFSCYTIWVIRCYYLININKIKIDIYKYFIEDKFSYFLIFIFLLIFIS